MNAERGQVWYVDLEPVVGSEIDKCRTCVVVSNNDVGVLPLAIIVPIKGWLEKYKDNDWMVHLNPNRVNGLSKESAADTFQVRSVSKLRFRNKIGDLNPSDMAKIDVALKISLDIED
jgi:mRNA interferase MazF